MFCGVVAEEVFPTLIRGGALERSGWHRCLPERQASDFPCVFRDTLGILTRL